MTHEVLGDDAQPASESEHGHASFAQCHHDDDQPVLAENSEPLQVANPMLQSSMPCVTVLFSTCCCGP